MNKKGLELSIAMVVFLIISVIMFIGAITLAFKFFGQAEDIRTELELSVQRDIERVMRQGTQIIDIPFNKKTVRRGEDVIFGLGVRNVLGTNATFCTYIRADPMAFQQNEQPIGPAYDTEEYDREYVQDNWVGGFSFLDEPGLMKNNDFKVVPLRIKPGSRMSEDAQTLRGTYVFDICVIQAPNAYYCTDAAAEAVKGTCDSCILEPLLCKQTNQVYTGKVLKAFVEYI